MGKPVRVFELEAAVREREKIIAGEVKNAGKRIAALLIPIVNCTDNTALDDLDLFAVWERAEAIAVG
jgi:hypothetical protein